MLIPLEVSLKVFSQNKSKVSEFHLNQVLVAYLTYFSKFTSQSSLSTTISYNNMLFMASIHRIKKYSYKAYLTVQDQLVNNVYSIATGMSYYIIKLFFFSLKNMKSIFMNNLKMNDLICKNGLLTEKGVEILDKSLSSVSSNVEYYHISKLISVLFNLISEITAGIIYNIIISIYLNILL